MFQAGRRARDHGDRLVHAEQCPRLAHDALELRCRNQGFANPVGGVGQGRRDALPPIGQVGDGAQIGTEARRFGRGQLGVPLRVLGVAVMGETEGPKIGRWQNQQGAAEPGHDAVQPAATERRAVDRLVQRREKEDQNEPVYRERRDEPDRALSQSDGRAGRAERS